ARQLERAAGRRGLAVEIHEAADRGAVHVADPGQVEDEPAVAVRDQPFGGVREIAEHGIGQPWLADGEHGNAIDAGGREIHSRAPGGTGWAISDCSRTSWRASSSRPRLMRDLTVPSGRLSRSAIS